VASVTLDKGVNVPVRDGIRLVADVYRPSRANRYPALLLRTPYDRRTAQTAVYAHPSWYAAHGYVVVVQDTRGRWGSEGDFDPIVTEADDGADTIEWMASQPWSNGRIGMYGFSYPGLVQLLAASQRPGGLRTIIPALAPSQMREGWLFNGGALALAFALGWSIELGRDLARRLRPEFEPQFLAALADPTAHYRFRPLRDQPLFRKSRLGLFYLDWLEHEFDAAYWHPRQVEDHYHDIEVPALHIGGWYDAFVDGTIRNFSGLVHHPDLDHVRASQRLIIGPWHHIPALTSLSQTDFGPEASPPIDSEQLRWFDLWLRDAGTATQGARVFAMGANRWLDFSAWPPPALEFRRLFLRSAGHANSRSGDGWLSEESPGSEPPDVFVYDPVAPVPSLGGHSCCFPSIAPMGPMDQTPIEALSGVLVFTSKPLDGDLLVAGPITARIYAGTDVRDTDWIVRVCDVREDGRSTNVQEGIIRSRHSGSSETPTLLTVGETREYDIFVGSTCYLFRRGHRIRVHITSSSFPAWEPNPNTGHPLGVDAVGDVVVGTQMVWHDASAPSAITLPFVDAAL
jgi:putative CocE/NonD family hydrolase